MSTTLPAVGVAPAAVPRPARPARVVLADGSPALLEPLGPADEPDVLDLHARMRERDRYLRFATLHPADLPGYVARTLAGEGGAVALGARVRGLLVGVVDLHPVGGDAAEVAAVVDAAWHGHGVATALLEELAASAVRLGVRRLLAEVLAENGRMMRVLTDLGLPLGVTRTGGSLHIEIALHADERYAAAAEDRYRAAAVASLRAVLTPRTVAVVGAGRSGTSLGRAVLRNLRRARFAGTVLAVNPHAERIEGFPCLPRLADLPEAPDLAVVAVPAEALAEVVEQCGERGARAVLVITSGVAERPGLPGRLRELADRYAMRLVGPNTVGVVGPGAAARLDTSFAPLPPLAGDVGLVTQSGGVAIAAGGGWQRLGLGLSAMVAIGDALDVGARDVLAWFDDDPGTRLAVVYAESEPDLRGLVGTAQHLARRMPVLALRSGTSAAGARAAESHTARAATPGTVREAAYDRAGIEAVDGLVDLSAAVALLRGQPLPGAAPVAVLTNAGGAGVLAADALAAAGLPVEPLPDAVADRLRAVLPALAGTGNPVDASAAVTAEQFAAAAGILLESPEIGAVLAITLPTAVSDPLPGVLAAARRGAGRPLVAVQPLQAAAVARIDLPGAADGRFLVSVADAGTAARALAVACRRRDWLARPPSRADVPEQVDVRAAREVVDGVLARTPDGDWLLPPEIDRLCAAAGLAAVRSCWATSEEAAVAAARAIGGPVAVKGHVRGVVHKGDAGLLRLPVSDPAEAGSAVAGWSARAGAGWLGAVVQPLVAPGDDVLVGALRDPAAGPVVVLGPGGRAADALGPRVYRLAPPTEAEVSEMLAGTGLFGTEHGRWLYRRGVADCVRRVAWLADALPEIAEIEINPLVVTERRAVALDVRARVEPRP